MLNRRPAAGSSEHQLMCASLPVTDNFSHPDLLDGCDRNPWRAQVENEEYCPFALGNVICFTIDKLKRILSATPYVTPPAPFCLPRPNHTLPPDLLESLDELLANAHIKLKESATKHLKDSYSFPNSNNSDGVPQLVQGTTNLTIPVPQMQSPELFYHTVHNPDSPVAHPGIGGFTGAHIRKRNPPEFHVAFQLSFPPADLQWEEARMKGTYNRERREGQPMRYGDGREQGWIQYKNGGRGWKRHLFHAAWWEFIWRFDCNGGNRIREKVWKNVYSKLVWASDSDLSQMWYTTSNAKSAETFPADMAGQRLPIIILNPLIDDKAMWDGSWIRRGEWFQFHYHFFMIGEWESHSGLGAPGKQDRGQLDRSGVPKLSQIVENVCEEPQGDSVHASNPPIKTSFTTRCSVYNKFWSLENMGSG
ncbi:uncharacterized protein EI90DRAFT_3175165 [Cantharellus anzutake]|uniref:uncharacterized protein n=1 Tax=Cantharellus anzutake TaxID=1750568 RepID=UPI001908EF6D|nr:uncharacterized protein EI90DRAFT_3175165 [Cantharellus anzutake]KAF8315305.1 hypothetical protein EI90DRAFT_3175165 [Cantharellus anzutake]